MELGIVLWKRSQPNDQKLEAREKPEAAITKHNLAR